MQNIINARVLEYCFCIFNIAIVGKMTCLFLKSGIYCMKLVIFPCYVFYASVVADTRATRVLQAKSYLDIILQRPQFQCHLLQFQRSTSVSDAPKPPSSLLPYLYNRQNIQVLNFYLSDHLTYLHILVCLMFNHLLNRGSMKVQKV